MKPSPYTDHYSQREIDDNYEAGLWSTDTFHDWTYGLMGFSDSITARNDRVDAGNGCKVEKLANCWLLSLNGMVGSDPGLKLFRILYG